MKTNPGGQIDVKDIVGCDAILQAIWEALGQQSIIMTAERRIGKTTIMKKMEEKPPEGWIPVFQDLEQYTSATEFAMSVYKAVQTHLSSKKRAANRVHEVFKSLGGAEVGGFFTLPPQEQIPWQNILSSAIEDLVKEQPEGNRLLFLWDEMPFMLANIRDQEDEETAMQVLNTLRSLRQTHKGFRMPMTGSIGLHHVLASFKNKGYSRATVNDMYSVDVPPLDLADAETLAKKLITGESLDCSDVDTTAQTVALFADGFPFYIHHIVRALKLERSNIEPDQVETIVQKQLMDDGDPWELQHYRSRIVTYYNENEPVVLLLLDELALREESASAKDLLVALKQQSDFDNLEHLRDLLKQLSNDHYLVRDTDGRYGFRFPLIQRWWKMEREL